MSEQNQNPDLNIPESDEKLEAAPLTQNSKLLRKLDNFWYHYKWTVIVVAFFVSVGVVCLVQFFTRPEYDTSIVMTTSYRMNSAEYSEFEKLIQTLLPSDFNGDGEKRVNVIVYQYYSPAEIEAEEEAAAERETDSFVYNSQYNNSELSAFTNLTMTGEVSVCIVSPDVYARLLEKDRLLPLSTLYADDAMPDGVRADGKGIDLRFTDFYRANACVSVLPDTSILCLLRPTVSGNSSQDENYEMEKSFFCAIAEFSAGEAPLPDTSAGTDSSSSTESAAPQGTETPIPAEPET